MRALFKATDIVRLGLRSLIVHKVRSALAILGIVFAVWSVIAVLAIGEGGREESQRSLREMGSNNIIIRSVKPPEGGGGASGQTQRIAAYGLKRSGVKGLIRSVPNIERAVVTHIAQRRAYANARRVPVSLVGTEPAYQQVVRIDMKAGRFLTNTDLIRAKSHAVLTAPLAEELYICEDPLGQTILVDGEPLLIVGVLENLPQAMALGIPDPDRCVIIPISADKSRFGELNFKRSQGGDSVELVEVSQLILQMTDEHAVMPGARIVRSFLERTHDERDYRIKVPRELLEQMAAQARVWSIVLLSIAAVSLIVGGIGIMNMMLASVTERTREIGIRRALGAKRRDIVVQFLVESVTLTAVGGAVGLLLGISAPWVVKMILDLPAILSFSMVLPPFVMAVFVGLVSGLYPAFRAARLDPIVALRHE